MRLRLAEFVLVAGVLVDALGTGLAAADVDQLLGWARTLMFVALGFAGLAIFAAGAAILVRRTSRAAGWYALVGAASLAAALSLGGIAFASDGPGSDVGGNQRDAQPRPEEPDQGQASPRDQRSRGQSAAELARRFRPILLFDSAEQRRPLNIELFLAEDHGGGERHRLCERQNRRCKPVEGVEDLALPSADPAASARVTYLDIVGDGAPNTYVSPRLDSCSQTTKLECDNGPASTIYYKVTRRFGRSFIDYWWFLRFNNVDNFRWLQRKLHGLCRAPKFRKLCFDHEGDWEGVTVITSATSPPALEGVIFAAHEWTLLRGASELILTSGRPTIFIARGSHAAYPQSCISGCKQPLKRGRVRWPEGPHDGLGAWASNDDQRCFSAGPCLLPLPRPGLETNAWTRWPGSWGYVCGRAGKRCPLGDGPRGPANQKRYWKPWCTKGIKTTCDAFVVAP